MSITVKQSVTFAVTATCDECGLEQRWLREAHINDEATPLELGFEMRDPRLYRSPDGVLWFHETTCLHRWVDANLIEHLRQPEGVRP